MVVRYQPPRHWITYDPYATMQPLLEAKAAVLALVRMPYQRSWAERLQEVQLKREVAGTSRIEGAEFTEQELEQSVRTPDSPAQLATRSQRQAAAAVRTYRWIAVLQGNEPVDVRTICEVHRRLVTDCDDDHCPPGRPRGADQNVTFGVPRHPGVEGGMPVSAHSMNWHKQRAVCFALMTHSFRRLHCTITLRLCIRFWTVMAGQHGRWRH